jgi:hypothetical protein
MPSWSSRSYPNGVLADVKQYVGKSGWLRVSKLTINMAENRGIQQPSSHAVAIWPPLLDLDALASFAAL